MTIGVMLAAVKEEECNGAKRKDKITFIVDGVEYEDNIDAGDALLTVADKFMTKLKNTGARCPEEWERVRQRLIIKVAMEV